MPKILICLILPFFIVLQASANNTKQAVQIAIVLDDVGNSQHDLQALTLPSAITFAILPYTPYAKEIARQAIKQGRDMLLHVPMQAKAHNNNLGAGALLLHMEEQQFKDTLTNALNFLPSVTGISNHMGSALTEHVKQMQWVMDVLYQQGLYFLDSRTTVNTTGEYSANISAIPALRRHVFLDNIKTEKAMEKQLQHAIQLGKKNTAVVIIAHPYPVTLKFLNERFAQQRADIKLVSLASLLSERARFIMAKKRSELQQVNNSNFHDIINFKTPPTQ